MTLNEIMNDCSSDKGDSIGAKHNYTPIYESYFEKHRNDNIRFMEVGIDLGQSVIGWNKYFTVAKIFMIDIRDFSNLNTNRVTCIRADQSKIGDLLAVANTVKEIDFFIDDGGHCMHHQQLTFGAIFPIMKSGGLFFIEDVHTSNWNPATQPPNSPGYCYGQPLMIGADGNNTIRVFKTFQKTGIFYSEFLSAEENKFLTESIDSVIIYDDYNNEVPIESSNELSIVKNGVILIRKK